MNDFLDFGDVEIKPTFKEKYKGVEGEKHRLGLIWPKEGGKGPFVMRNTWYLDKYIIAEGHEAFIDKLGPSKTRLGCLVVKYKTKKDGTLIKRVDDEIPFDFEVLEWVFSEKKFSQLKSLHDEWDLKKHDLMVTCSGEKFQNLEFVPCKESIWQVKAEFKEAIYKESEPVRSNLARSLGQEVTSDELKELLGLEVAQHSDVISSEAELTDILETV